MISFVRSDFTWNSLSAASFNCGWLLLEATTFVRVAKSLEEGEFDILTGHVVALSRYLWMYITRRFNIWGRFLCYRRDLITAELSERRVSQIFQKSRELFFSQAAVRASIRILSKLSLAATWILYAWLCSFLSIYISSNIICTKYPLRRHKWSENPIVRGKV